MFLVESMDKATLTLMGTTQTMVGVDMYLIRFIMRPTVKKGLGGINALVRHVIYKKFTKEKGREPLFFGGVIYK